ncbi:putative NADH:ubiquinone reductase (H(+)-translocating) (mitochondrion) [Lupinus albus]|uniref:NADH-ubiquinone oxidoreductase chain 4 n=1 Tax=Lupinus albus TaxID=3870 RepID=A0A6A4MR48_LUPAL|nr:putative NADH:ubiquinone reductase (H(+)-translocating) [Lupinus albus]
MLLAILLILFQTGTADLQISLTTEFSERRQIFLWIASFSRFRRQSAYGTSSYLVTRSSCRGTYGRIRHLGRNSFKIGNPRVLRFSIPMFPEATLCSTPFIYTPSAIAIIYTSLTTSRQIDLKKIIAYSSVAHMNLVTIGMFSRAGGR